MKEICLCRGVVISYMTEKSFGFVRVKEVFNGTEWVKQYPMVVGSDAFIYYKDIEPEKDGFKKLIQGQITEFTAYRGPKGLTAKNLKIIGEVFDDEGEVSGNN